MALPAGVTTRAAADAGLAWRVEQTCRNAWPALRMVWIDDWLLHFAEGLTRRANSTNPLRLNSRISDALIAACETLYHREHQPAIFRLPSIIDAASDQLLAGHYYTSEGENLALYAEIAGIHAAPDAAMQLFSEPVEEWCAAMSDLQRHNPEQSRTYRRIVEALAVPAAFAMLTVDGRPAALAFGALHDRFLCYESVIVDSRWRRQGFARRLVSSLAAWSRDRGAEGLCLEVEAANTAALALYGSLGFRELYRYHYRRQPQPFRQ